MGAEPLERKLAAILYADVAGYSRLTGEDEEGTHRALSAHLDAITASIEKHNGTVLHFAGDAVLSDFATVSDALICAVTVQQDLKERNKDLSDDRKVQFRIGVNLGEVIVDRGEIYGDGVNVAARLESLAEPGGICISESVRTSIGNNLPLDYEFWGEQEVKNIAEPVKAYSAELKPGATLPAPSVRPQAQRPIRHPIVVTAAAVVLLVGMGVIAWLQPWVPHEESDKPSIAVLPFQTLSDDPSQDYFSDGVTNDIITDLSKFSNLLVIASHSVFTYKDKPVNIKDVGRELGVRYVLEGTIQKSANRVRINAQLIDATTNRHLWADRYDFELDDIFRVQDEITNTIVTSLQVILTEDEQGRAGVRHTEVVEAYDLFLRGRTYLRGTKKTHLQARKLFDQAIELDPDFAAAYAEKSFTYFSSFIMPMSRDPKVVKGALEAAERAVALDDALPLAHARLAWAYFSTREHAKAIAAARRAVALGPNDAEAHAQLGNVLNWSGKPEEGKLYVERAMRLNPHYPYYYLFYLGQSHYLLENREEAIELMKRVMTRAPYFLPVRRHLAVLYTEVGLLKKAKAQTAEVLRIFPGASIEDSRARCLYRRTPKLLTRFFAGLRKSGMPEGKAGEEPMSM
ncbi:MAG: adenylate/guanylate cyclase domain-containing protein [Acidiferrobacterales bacterium]|nr:tetratricopeptide repeat protein [Gammaproteobacteria bacterium]